jgi:hypothetical protein
VPGDAGDEIGLLPLTGCHNPERLEGLVKTMEPLAVEAAVERGRTDLNCGTVKTEVLSREHGDLANQYNLHRVVYRIEARAADEHVTPWRACSRRLQQSRERPQRDQ